MALFVWLRKVISSSEFYVNNFTSMAAAPVHFALLDEVGPAIGTDTGVLNVRFRMLKVHQPSLHRAPNPAGRSVPTAVRECLWCLRPRVQAVASRRRGAESGSLRYSARRCVAVVNALMSPTLYTQRCKYV